MSKGDISSPGAPHTSWEVRAPHVINVWVWNDALGAIYHARHANVCGIALDELTNIMNKNVSRCHRLVKSVWTCLRKGVQYLSVKSVTPG